MQKLRSLLLPLYLLLLVSAKAQFVDDFTDGNFTSNPAWTGAVTKFIVNPAGQLQLNDTEAATTRLSAAFAAPDLIDFEWQAFIRLAFAPSANNFARIYLVSDEENLTGSLNGYFLQFGEAGSNDAIELFRQSGTSTNITSILRGTTGAIASSFSVRVKVLRDENGTWQLFADYTGGTNFVFEASGIDNTYTSSSYLGVRCTYTASNTSNFYFDDFYMGPRILDTVPPEVQSIQVLSANEIEITFNEDVNELSAVNPANYVLNNNLGPAQSVSFLNERKVSVEFPSPFPNGELLTITINNVEDIAGNSMSNYETTFRYFVPEPAEWKDIIISEFFPDPDPPVALPNQEFVEIYNRSNKVFNLLNWKLIDPGATGTLKELFFFPGDYLILATNAGAPLFDSYGQAMGITGMPTLNNNGDILELRDPEGNLIDSLSYDLTWYQDNDKRDGGWTIEVIDPDNFCTDKENYKASVNENGGTPGEQNSVFTLIDDTDGPQLQELINVDGSALTLKFNERLKPDAINALFDLHPSLTIAEITFENIIRDEIRIDFTEQLQIGTSYQVTVNNIFDCKGNEIDSDHTSLEIFIVADPPVLSELEVINASTIKLTFSEEIEAVSATDADNYTITDQLVNPQSAIQLENNIVELSFGNEFINGKTYTLLISGVKGIYENEIIPIEESFLYFVPVVANKYDIIITELFPDPAPPVQLPEHEFVEIYNRSVHPFDLAGWKLIDPGANGTLPSYLIQPGEYVILTSTSGVPKFELYGKVLGVVGMPVLSNNSDQLSLVSPEGLLVDSVNYQISWYRDNEKRDGGWTLERIDYDDFCNDADNWIASEDETGGTPGSVNSVFETQEQTQAPKLTDVIVDSQTEIKILFDKKLNHKATEGDVLLEPEASVLTKTFTNTSRNEIEVKLEQPLNLGEVYSVHVENMFDCNNNSIDPEYAGLEFLVIATPPVITEILVIDANHLSIIFSEQLDEETVLNKSNYNVLGSIGEPSNIILNQNQDAVELFFLQSFVNGQTYSIQVSGIRGLYNNEIAPTQKSFLFFEPIPANRKDIIISELFPDPTPPVGLPEYEFVEIYNRSELPFDLTGWKLVDPGASGNIPPYLMQPGEYIILASAAAASHYQQFGTVLIVSSMPVLNNSSEQVYLVSPEGLTVDSISYTLNWYKDNDKRDGGWTLELIDLNDVCKEAENWMASEDPSGGTPGRVNSVNDHRPDLTGPMLLQVIALSANQLLLQLNEKLNDATPDEIIVQISDNILVGNISFYNQAKTQLLVTLLTEIEASKVYSIQLSNVFDCPGNKIQEQYRTAEFVLTEEALPGDVVINEILFNPRPGGVDFVEIYNNSNKYFNVKNWFVGNYQDGNATNLRVISNQDELFAPAEFMILTSSIDILKGDYPQTKDATAHIVNLPSYPDREGTVSLVDASSVLLDYFIYHENFHNPMLRSKEGVSLERVSAITETNLEANWKSAASVVGFASPGYINSSARGIVNIETSSIKIEPEVFIPQYGVEDFTRIIYSFEQGGLSANVFIIDQQGRKVKTVANNELLNSEGFLTWDGSDDTGNKVRMGSYMIYFQVFNAGGELQTIRKRVVIASRF